MSTRIVVLSLAAMGCVNGNNNDVPDDPDRAAFTRAEAKAGGNALAASLEDAAAIYGPITLGATFAADCATPSGDASDPDNDSIPANAILTYDCSARRLGYTGTLAGTTSIADDEPNAVAWAFTGDASLHASLTGPFGGSMVTDTDGSIVASQQSVVGPYDLSLLLDVVTVITNVRGIETRVSENIDWTVSFTPQVQWTPGGVVVTGALATDGSWNVAAGKHEAEATLSTPTPLTLTPSCATRITAGLVRATFASGAGEASISVQWSGCGQSTVSYEAP